MIWKILPLFCTVALASLLSAQDSQPTFKSKAELVLVPTVVTKAGKPVAGLTKENFVLLHDGKQEQVASFEEVETVPASMEPVPLPPHTVQNYAEADGHQDIVILLLDFLNGGWSTANHMRSYLKDMANQLAETRTPVTVLLLTNKGLVQVHSFTSAPENLTKVVEQWTSKLSVVNDENSGRTIDGDVGSAWPGAMRDANVLEGTRALLQFARLPGNSQRQLDKASMTLQAVEDISQAFRGIPGRKKMIWMSTGFPRLELVEQIDSGPPDSTALSGGRISNPQSPDVFTDFKLGDRRRHSWASLSDANIAVYPLDSNGVVSPAWEARYSPQHAGDRLSGYMQSVAPPASLEVTSDTLSMLEVAQKTGGQSCSDLPTACVKKAQADANHYYLLGFYLSGDKKAGWHKLNVKMNLPDVTARTRQGFMVGPPEVSGTGKNKKDGKKLSAIEARKEPGRLEEYAILDEATLISALASTLDYTSVPLRLSWSRLPSQNDSTTSKVELVIQSPPDGIAVDAGSQKLNVDYLAFIRPVGKTEGHYYPDTLVMKLSPAQQKGLGEEGFRYRHKLDLAPGRYEVRVLLRDNVSQKIGTVSTVVDLLSGAIAKQ